MRALGDIAVSIQARRDMSLVLLATETLVFRYRYVSTRGTRLLMVRAGIEGGWDHIAVTAPGAAPSARQMQAVQRFVMQPGEWMMQLYAPLDGARDRDETTLHLWRPQNADLPLPPPDLVVAAAVA